LLLEDDLKIELLLMLLNCEVTKTLLHFCGRLKPMCAEGEEAAREVAVILQD
jgi:hypothetical protein